MKPKKQVKKIVNKEKVKPTEPDTKRKDMDMACPKPKWYSLRQRWQQRKRFRQDHINFLINMELANGFTMHFIVYPHKREGSFKFLKKKYIIDQNLKYYNLSASMWCLDYHENFSAPIQRKIAIKEIKDEINKDDNIEIEYATNPSLIEEFTVSKIAEGIMKGRQIDETLRKIVLILFIIGAVNLIHFLMYLKKEGVI